MYLCMVCTLSLVAFVFSIYFSHTDVVGDLLINSSMYIYVSVAFVLLFLMLNDIGSFPLISLISTDDNSVRLTKNGETNNLYLQLAKHGH